MSPIFGAGEVSAGPTVGCCHGRDGPPTPAYAGKVPEKSQGDGGAVVENGISCMSLLLTSGAVVSGRKSVERNGFWLDLNGPPSPGSSSSSSSSSSIGPGGDTSSITNAGDEGGGAEEEVQSEFKGGLGSMASLESSLPIKRGLSNFFTGKSKSFASLSQVTTIKELQKPENPYNKRRRTLVAYKTARTQSKKAFNRPLTSFPPLSIPSPDFTLEEDDEEKEEEIEKAWAPLPLHRRKLKSYKKNPRSFSLTDLGDA